MEHNQQKQRRTAAREFLKSLEQFEDIFDEDKAEEEGTSEQHSVSMSDDQRTIHDALPTDLAALEDAIADIEQYMAQKSKNHKSTS